MEGAFIYHEWKKEEIENMKVKQVVQLLKLS
jgi:hypothetical protein